MKLVFNENEVAESLGRSVEEFRAIKPKLEDLGFPQSVVGLEDCWPLIEVINWVNNKREPSLQN